MAITSNPSRDAGHETRRMIRIQASDGEILCQPSDLACRLGLVRQMIQDCYDDADDAEILIPIPIVDLSLIHI